MRKHETARRKRKNEKQSAFYTVLREQAEGFAVFLSVYIGELRKNIIAHAVCQYAGDDNKYIVCVVVCADGSRRDERRKERRREQAAGKNQRACRYRISEPAVIAGAFFSTACISGFFISGFLNRRIFFAVAGMASVAA